MALTGMNRFAALNNVNTDGQDGEVTFKSNFFIQALNQVKYIKKYKL